MEDAVENRSEDDGDGDEKDNSAKERITPSKELACGGA